MKKAADEIAGFGNFFQNLYLNSLKIDSKTTYNYNVRFKEVFSRSLSIESFAQKNKRENVYDSTIHEQKGFIQVLDDYSLVKQTIESIEKIRKFLEVLSPFFLFFLILVLLISLLRLFDKTNSVLSLIPFLNKNLSTFYTIFIIGTILMYIVCSSLKISSKFKEDNANKILLDYESLSQSSCFKSDNEDTQSEKLEDDLDKFIKLKIK